MLVSELLHLGLRAALSIILREVVLLHGALDGGVGV